MFPFRFLSFSAVILAIALCITATQSAQAGGDPPYSSNYNTYTPGYLVSTDWSQAARPSYGYSYAPRTSTYYEGQPYYSYNYNTYTPRYLVSRDWSQAGRRGDGYSYSYTAGAPVYLSGSTAVTGNGGAPYNGTATFTSYSPASKSAANIRIRVPADAKLWFDDYQTKQTGEMRTFTTPELPVDKVSTYQIRVRWNDHGAAKEEMRRVDVRGGQQMDISFPNPEKLPKAAK